MPLLRLLRLPAVFTAWADPFLGYALTHNSLVDWGPLLLLVISTSCLYLGGMVLNDVCDYELDKQERSERPLPLGQISLKFATTLAAGLLFAGIAFAAAVGTTSLLVAVPLVVAIVLYDRWLKRTPFGPLGMGACRSLNVLLGASHGTAIPWPDEPLILGIAALMGLYIVGVTWFARTEAQISSRWQLSGAALTIVASIIGLAGLLLSHSSLSPAVNTVAMLFVVLFTVARRLVGGIFDPQPATVQAAIPMLLFSYVMLAATTVFWSTNTPEYGLATAALIVPSALLARVIKMT